jgi:hypothetical protein
MTDDDKTTPIISLAAKRKESERDFAQERADLTKELEEIGVAADQLAAITQHTNAMGKMKAIACGGVHDLRAFWQRFYEQRRAAGQRGVEWQLDFRQWLEIWQASGHLHERGRCRGQFQMCRSGDIGPYASSTVRIDRMENNASEGRLRLERQAGGVTACSS